MLHAKLLTTFFLLLAVVTASAAERNACRVGEPAIDHDVLALIEEGVPVGVKLVTVHGVAREMIADAEASPWTPYPRPAVAETARPAPAASEIARRPRSLRGYHVEE